MVYNDQVVAQWIRSQMIPMSMKSVAIGLFSDTGLTQLSTRPLWLSGLTLGGTDDRVMDENETSMQKAASLSSFETRCSVRRFSLFVKGTSTINKRGEGMRRIP